MNPMTNGAWTLTVNKGDVSEKQYTFTVTASGLSSNNFPAVQITTPADGSPAVATNTPFSWSGPASWNELFLRNHNLNYSFDAADFPAPATTSWNTAPPMPLGTNEFEVNYSTNGAPWFTISTPVNNLSQPFTNWVGGSKLFTFVQSGFVTSTNPAATGGGGGHTLVAHYPFDNSGNLGQDTSGNGNDMNVSSSWGTNHQFSVDAEAGGGAVQFFGTSSLVPGDSTRTNWDLTLAGSFSMSAWVKTTAFRGNNSDNAYFGATIFWAFNDHNGTNDTIPLAITGSKAAFTTRDHLGNFNTLHSATTVNNGSYHLLTVTRNQVTGEKKIYVDGNFETSEIGTTDPLNGNDYYLSIGGTTSSSYTGLLDDVQFYSGVLSASEVTYLYNNPGTNVANIAANSQDLNTALGTTNLNWATSGNSSWFVETTNTYNGAPSAAHSGSVTNAQSTTLSVTVTGPGTVTFYWSSIANDPNTGFDYRFYIDDPNTNGLADLYSGVNPWAQAGSFAIPTGQHTLGWTVYPNGDTDPTQAGFLDQVSYVVTTAPVMTLNPFNQTNYPGYNVALLAAATAANTNATITWQWFKVGSALPIPNATSALFIPTNSGTAGVAGNYYAVASTPVGSANTTTAAVSFVSAALPPDWSAAFKSPFQPVNQDLITKDYYYGCITDTNGNLYVAAEFGGNTTFGSFNLNSGSTNDAAAIVKQSPTGAPLWAVGITNNGNGSANAYCVAPAPGSGVYVAGNYSGNNWLGTNKLTDAGNGDIFLARFTATGSNVWLKTFGSTNNDFLLPDTLAADPAGNVTFAALLGAGPVSIGSSNYNIAGQQGVLVQLDQTGAVRWSQLLPAGSSPELLQYLTYNAGRLYVSLNTESSGGITNVFIGGISNVTDRAWAVACLNETNGQAIWVRGVGAKYGSGNGNPLSTGLLDDVPRLAVSGTNVFLTGVAYDSTATFGAITVNFGDLRGQYFARYDMNGNAQVATTYGSITTSPNTAVADANGNVYVSGNFDTYSFFGNDIIATPVATRLYKGSFSQAFLAKFDRNGNPLWARDAVVSTYGTVNFLGLALATDGVWASGWTKSGYYPEVLPTLFGTNSVFSDALFIHGGAGGSTSIIWYPGGVLAKITDGAAAAQPVTLINPANSGANFQFQFQSQSGFNHSILYRTNLAVGTWQTNSTVIGDGTVKIISLPFSLFNPSKQGFIRVSTQ